MTSAHPIAAPDPSIDRHSSTAIARAPMVVIPA